MIPVTSSGLRTASIPAKRHGIRLLRRPEEAGLGAVGTEGSPLPVPEDNALPQDDRAHGGYGEVLSVRPKTACETSI